MNILTLILSYIGSAPALLLLTSILLFLINKKYTAAAKQATEYRSFSATVTLMLCVASILLWLIHKLYPVSSASLNWWHVSWASILLVLLAYSIKRQLSSVFIGIVIFIPISFVSVAALSFLNSKTVSGLLIVLGYLIYGLVIYRKAQYPESLASARATVAPSESLSTTHEPRPVDPAALELRLKSQEAIEGADKYTRE